MKKSKKLGRKSVRNFGELRQLGVIREDDLVLAVGGAAGFEIGGDITCAVVIDGRTYEHTSYVIGHTH